MKKICCRCNLEINEKKDRWVNIRDFDKGKNKGEKDMHLECWKVMYKNKIQKAFNEKAKEISPVIQNLIGGIVGGTKHEY